MNLNVTIDWKFVVALGTVVVGTMFAVKMDSDAVERVSIHAIDACRDYAVAGNSDCQTLIMLKLKGTQSFDYMMILYYWEVLRWKSEIECQMQ